MRRPALLLGTGAVVLVLALLAVWLVVLPDDRDTADDSTSTGPTTAQADLSTVLSDGFDDGTGRWEPLGDGVRIAQDQQVTRSGAGSLLVVGRTEAWHGAQVDVSGTLTPGVPHTVTAWVRLGLGGGADPTDDAAHRTGEVRLTLQRRDGGAGDDEYLHVAQVTATADEWMSLSGTVDLPAGDGTWRLYVETTGTLADLRMDDVLVQRPSSPVQSDLTGLRDAADVPVGTAVAGQDLTGRRADLLTQHFDQVTAENAMKPAVVQPVEGEFDFGPMDQILDFAVEHHLTVHGHVLVWHRSTPDWFVTAPDGRPLTDSPADQQLLRDRLRTHIQAVAAHLADRYGDNSPVTSWDVVNEAIDPAQSDGLRRSPWYTVLGPGYIADAFRTARDVLGPDVALYLNDYDTDAPERRRALVALVTDLLAHGVPLDGVGHQMHLRLGADVTRIDTTLAAVQALGVRQAVTELDIALTGPDQTLTAVTDDQLAAQGDLVREVVAAAVAHDIASITVWGLYDTRSWLRTWPTDRPLEAPLLFDDDLQAKPAYRGFLAGLGTSPNSDDN